MKEDLLKTLEASKNYTVAVAEAMPENDYSFKPKGAGWSFAELMDHIAYGIHWWKDNFIVGNETAWNPPSVKGSKKEIIISLQAAYEALRESIKSNEGSQQVVYGFHATTDHISHHRGQAVLYLRLKGITPPEYTF